MRGQILQRVMNYRQSVCPDETSRDGREIERFVVSKHVLDRVPMIFEEG